MQVVLINGDALRLHYLCQVGRLRPVDKLAFHSAQSAPGHMAMVPGGRDLYPIDLDRKGSFLFHA